MMTQDAKYEHAEDRYATILKTVTEHPESLQEIVDCYEKASVTVAITCLKLGAYTEKEFKEEYDFIQTITKSLKTLLDPSRLTKEELAAILEVIGCAAKSVESMLALEEKTESVKQGYDELTAKLEKNNKILSDNQKVLESKLTDLKEKLSNKDKELEKKDKEIESLQKCLDLERALDKIKTPSVYPPAFPPADPYAPGDRFKPYWLEPVTSVDNITVSYSTLDK